MPDSRPEKDAIFRIFAWPAYIAPVILRRFEHRYGCRIEYTTFDTMDEAIARLRTGTTNFDLFFPTVDVVGRLADAGILQPLNLAYLPNLANVWPSLQSPFYDTGPRYTVPYFVWTTGIAWRNDLLQLDLPAMDNPYDVFWDPRVRGHVHLLNGSREAIAMALLRGGIADVNTGRPSEVTSARESLLDLVDLASPRFDHTDYRDLFSGAAHLHQSWSGNIGFAPDYAPQPSDVADLSYWWPASEPGISGVVGSDAMAVPRGARNPVLAHLLINELLDERAALINSAYEGYQSPLRSIDPDRLVSLGVVPPNLRSTIADQQDFVRGVRELELLPTADQLWQQTYDEIIAASKPPEPL